MSDLDKLFESKPPPKKRRRSKRKKLEAAVLRDCLKFLKADPRVIYVERRSTGAVQFQDGGFMRFGSKGAADVWCLVKIPLYVIDIPAEDEDDDFSRPSRLSGNYLVRHIELEIKRADGKGRQSSEQKEFQEFCNKSGIPYFLVKSVDELKSALDEFLSST